ncbi:MAG TPA: GlsB/YeaQ/YmgE family stress response membrane protein [Candidatus Binatia bacterium]
MLGWIGWIIFGVSVGIVGKFLMPGRDPGGFLVTILLGIAGALLGGFVGRALGFYQEGEPAGFIMAVIGAIILLAIYRAVIGRRRTV